MNAAVGTRAEPDGTASLPHMPQLDGLRALAVFPVVIQHLLIDNPFALYGVKLFFVLSGFLITGILLRSRETSQATGQPRMRALGNFYARRALRIFPLYYLVVIVAITVNLGPARRLVWWLVTYTLNFLMGGQGYYEAYFAHFWSLCVEEQFYLFWPWIILLVPTSRLVPLIVGTIILPLILRFGVVWSGYLLMTAVGTFVNPLMNLDGFAAGALLALLHQHPEYQRTTLPILRRYALPASFVTVLLLAVAQLFRVAHVYFLFHDTALAALFTSVIAAASVGVQGPVGKFLSWGPITQIGKVSYGIYVYHPFVPSLLTYALSLIGIQRDADPMVGAISVPLSMGIALVSWHGFEAPINRLKRHFKL